MQQDENAPWISGACEGEVCRCGRPAVAKVEEAILSDDPHPFRHPLSAYVCRPCFVGLMGQLAEGRA